MNELGCILCLMEGLDYQEGRKTEAGFTNCLRHKRGNFGNPEQVLQIEEALLRMKDRARRRGETLERPTLVALSWQLHKEIVQGKPPTARRVNGLANR